MRRLILGFAGRTYHIVVNPMPRLIWSLHLTYTILCMLDIFSCPCCRLLTFPKNSFRNTIRVSISLVPEQDRHYASPDLGTRPCSAVGRESDCRSRDRKFDWSINNFYGHSPFPPPSESRRLVVSYKSKYVHKVLVNCLVHDQTKPKTKLFAKVIDRQQKLPLFSKKRIKVL